MKILLLLPFLLSGCMWQTVNITDFKKSELFCVDHGGVRSIVVLFNGTEHVYCIDGATIVLNKFKLPTNKRNKL